MQDLGGRPSQLAIWIQMLKALLLFYFAQFEIGPGVCP